MGIGKSGRHARAREKEGSWAFLRLSLPAAAVGVRLRAPAQGGVATGDAAIPCAQPGRCCTRIVYTTLDTLYYITLCYTLLYTILYYILCYVLRLSRVLCICGRVPWLSWFKSNSRGPRLLVGACFVSVGTTYMNVFA